MTSPRVRRYALAGAMAVKVADLFTHLHAAGAGPASGEAASTRDVEHALRCSLGLGAAGACSAVVARLTIVEREAAGAALGIIEPPQRLEPGVTVLDGVPHSTWATTVRTAAAAGAELNSARESWRTAEGPAADDVRKDLEVLAGYVERLAGLLDVTEPDPAATTEGLSPGLSH